MRGWVTALGAVIAAGVASPARGQEGRTRPPEAGTAIEEPRWAVMQDRFDPRISSGLATTATGAAALTMGLAGLSDNGGVGGLGSLSRAGVIGGSTAIGLGGIYLGWALFEGTDSPRRSEGMTMAGQYLTALGFAMTAGFQGAMVFDYFDDRGLSGMETLFSMFPSATMYVTGVGLWFGGARDAEDLWVRRPYRRSPAMATMGGLALTKGLLQMGTGLFVATNDEAQKPDSEVMAISLATGTAVDLSVGTAMMILGLSETEVVLPKEIPDVALGPGRVDMTWTW